VAIDSTCGLKSRGKAAVVFQPLATADFAQIAKDVEQVVRATGEETGTTVESKDDSFGYRWFVLSDPDVDDLAVGLNAITDALEMGGYGERILCAVFAFADEGGAPAYFIYNYKRGAWYPFVPSSGEQQRNNEKELQLKAQLAGELPWEAELERWFPMWGTPI
jgi:hypothetical protein